MKNSNFIILSVIVLCVVAIGAFFVGKKSTDLSTFSTRIVPSISSGQTEAPSQPSGWYTSTVLYEKSTEYAGDESISLRVARPSNWTMRTIPRQPAPQSVIKNCADIELTNAEGTVALLIDPICAGWSAEYVDLPAQTTIVTTRTNTGSDGQTVETIRYFDPATKNYLYVDSEPATNKIMKATVLVNYDKSNEGFIPFYIHFENRGMQIIDEETLKTVDQIVANLKEQ